MQLFVNGGFATFPFFGVCVSVSVSVYHTAALIYYRESKQDHKYGVGLIFFFCFKQNKTHDFKYGNFL